MKLKFCLITLQGFAVSLISVNSAMAQTTTFIRSGITTGGTVTTVNTNAVRQVNIVNVNGLVPYQNNTIVPFQTGITNTSVNTSGSSNLGIGGDRIFTVTIPSVQTNTIINRTVIYPNTSTTTTVGGFVTNAYGRINPVEQTNIYSPNYSNGSIPIQNSSFSQNPNSITIINVIPPITNNSFCVNGICTSNSIQDSSRRSLILLNDSNRYGSSYRIR